MKNYLDIKSDCNYEKLIEVSKILKNGGIVIFPTETVYGIGVNALDENAIKKLYKVKNRPHTKPISVLVSNLSMVNSVAENITPLEYKLMEAFFPGPLTLVLHKKSNISDILTANTDTIGVRMPDNIVAQKLIEYAGVPLATSSANISDKPSGTNIESIINDFQDTVDYFVDSGESKIGISSTVVQLIDNVPHILREGSITLNQINQVLSNNIG